MAFQALSVGAIVSLESGMLSSEGGNLLWEPSLQHEGEGAL